MKAILKINDKEIEVEVSEEQIEKMTEKKNPFERVAGRKYYFISSNIIDFNFEDFDDHDELLYSIGNYCTDKDLIRQQVWRETLNRLLWRWQYENDEPLDWGRFRFSNFCIFKSGADYTPCANYYKQQGTVYFSTIDKAKQAIEEVVKPFMAEHPEFVW